MLTTASHCARIPRAVGSQIVRTKLRYNFNTHVSFVQQRGIHDLLNVSGKPIISYGPPGRSASGGHVATVFGCTGFLGRYLVAKLGAVAQSMISVDH